MSQFLSSATKKKKEIKMAKNDGIKRGNRTSMNRQSKEKEETAKNEKKEKDKERTPPRANTTSTLSTFPHYYTY